MHGRKLDNFLLLVNDPPAFAKRYKIADRHLAAGVLGLAALWREVVGMQPILGAVFDTVDLRATRWARRERERFVGRRKQYVENVALPVIEEIAQEYLMRFWQPWQDVVVKRFAGDLSPEEGIQLLRETETRLARVLPRREEILRARLAKCPLCSRVFVRPKRKRAQKYCQECRKQWSPKQRWARLQKQKSKTTQNGGDHHGTTTTRPR